MKTTLAIVVLGSLAFATSGANAYQSRANGYQTYWNPDRQAYVNRTYQSGANGCQTYWNPDRQTYMKRASCNWKTSHKHTIRQADRR